MQCKFFELLLSSCGVHVMLILRLDELFA